MQAEKLTWSAVQNDDKITLRLVGELSRDTLLPLWQQRLTFLSEKQIADKDILWDLAQIKRIDSAGFALLCDLIAYCRKIKSSEHKIVLINIPKQLLTLADLFNLNDWLTPFISKN
ncbi:STAS domain-containing protein [Lonepinella koalarum]|uniref:Phospholipid transport system transporter-binding protein n=1 Tax=Lonepinella koalarum TaxID=53417 RepID=A0A4R1KWW1_9PAST|nr:lipid asymmetry maintenance protein MlaB [Lonepinella koalarum]MDH2927610.1 NTP-binding protein [Lonepinella koalarum]TCK69802.1 phospholipid transport system transporter-binding protein [Lonepinella koalarum]TFJ90587.1 STAS domain-containing protein [Lonepinella koalarum]TYG35330.1 STAS domain-containing protein [Lonepinella koalarum]